MIKQSLPSTKSSSNSKLKKTSKDREKRKSQGSNFEVNNHEKGSPTKDCSARQYAGIDAESLAIYAEQSSFEHLSEEISNTLTEDINYRLRYVINDALIKARLSGRNAINSSDLEQTFENLNIDRIYGASAKPNWVPLENQNLFYLDDNVINLIEIVEQEDVYTQPGTTIITKKWMPEQLISKPHRNYFAILCKMIVSNHVEERQVALRDLHENPRIGPISEWFYNFGFTLLSKDITYDCLTLRAIDLIRELECSPICRMNAPERQLKLLVRLILQRLLKSSTTKEVLKPMCSVLALLCQRPPLKDFVITKVLQKLQDIAPTSKLSIVILINCLGPEAIEKIFLPNMNLFLTEVAETELTYAILELYNVLCKMEFINADIYNAFSDVFEQTLVPFYNPFITSEVPRREEINVINVKRALLKTRRKIDPCEKKMEPPIEEVFEMPAENCPLRKKLNCQKYEKQNIDIEGYVCIGKTSLLLPVMKKRKNLSQNRCCHHLWYNI